MMQQQFHQPGATHPKFKRKVLRQAQIKSWLSQENSRRKEHGVMTMISRGLQEVVGVLCGGSRLEQMTGGVMKKEWGSEGQF